MHNRYNTIGRLEQNTCIEYTNRTRIRGPCLQALGQPPSPTEGQEDRGEVPKRTVQDENEYKTMWVHLWKKKHVYFPSKFVYSPTKSVYSPPSRKKDTTMHVHPTPETLAPMSSKKPKTEIPVPINKEPKNTSRVPKGPEIMNKITKSKLKVFGRYVLVPPPHP